MEKPVLAVNWKHYASGIQAFPRILRVAKRFAHKLTIILIPPHSLLFETIRHAHSRMRVYAQHCDALVDERATGFLPVNELVSIGAHGSLLNHSEHPLSMHKLRETLRVLHEHGLESLVAASSPAQLERVARLKPSFLAFEPPELIGTGRSVTKVQPRIVKDAVRIANETPLLVGAGIVTGEDALRAVMLGAHGVLVASGIVHTQNPEEAFTALARGLLKGMEKTKANKQ